MNLQEIKNYIDNGDVCVDISYIKRYSGFVRKVNFYAKNRVCIEFVGFGIDEEQGYEFCHTFNSIEEAISAIERFLEKPMDKWINHTKTGIYPEEPNEMDIRSGENKLLEDIRSKNVHLPDKELFEPKFRL